MANLRRGKVSKSHSTPTLLGIPYDHSKFAPQKKARPVHLAEKRAKRAAERAEKAEQRATAESKAAAA